LAFAVNYANVIHAVGRW